MNTVVQQAIRDSSHRGEKSDLESGEIFVNIPGLNMNVAGVSIPALDKYSPVTVSFTADHFRMTDVAKLA
jgi:hypothetical protein